MDKKLYGKKMPQQLFGKHGHKADHGSFISLSTVLTLSASKSGDAQQAMLLYQL
jgi:hypothetical protein